jgi:hypothetical protein
VSSSALRAAVISPVWAMTAVRHVVVDLAAAQVHACGGESRGVCLLVCAGQTVLRTVSVAVRVMGLSRAKTHHSADLAFCARYAALRYSLIRPLRTSLRSIRAVISTALPGWRCGGSCCRLWCGRWRL